MAETHVPFQKVTLETVDGAVKRWLDLTVDARVVHPGGSGEQRKVPVVYSSGERWVTARERKAIRDDKGVVILPVISFRRTGMDRDPTMSALGTETARLNFHKRITEKTSEIENLNAFRTPSLRTPTKPLVFEVTSIPFPDRNILNYELQVQCQYVTQVNAVIEKLVNTLDVGNSFVAPLDGKKDQPQTGVEFEQREPVGKRGGYVVGFFDASVGDQGNLDEFTDQERIVRWSTTLRVPAVLNLDPQGDQPAIQVKRTAYVFNFGDERVHFTDAKDRDKIFGRLK